MNLCLEELPAAEVAFLLGTSWSKARKALAHLLQAIQQPGGKAYRRLMTQFPWCSSNIQQTASY